MSAARLAAGGIEDIFAVYAGIDSGRLVIVGGPGTGKTGAAILLMRAALQHRERLSAADRAATPVPVLLSCHVWDPSEETFNDWLAGQLKISYRFLRAAEYGADAAERLVAQGRIAIVLDGFDETPADLRPAIIGRLDAQAQCRLVLLSRGGELQEVAGRTHLAGAGALELLPVEPDDAADYLIRCRVYPASETWQKFTKQVREREDAAVTEALSRPLMLTLVRDTFQEDGEVEQLGPGRFGTSAQVEQYLLDKVLPAAYTPRPGRSVPRYTAQQAELWLGHLAHRMRTEDTADLAWWRIPSWQPPLFRTVANGLLAAAVFGVLGTVAFGLRFGGIIGIIGFAAGCLVGAFAEWRPDDRPVRLAPIRWRALASPSNSKLNLIGLVGGLGYGAVGGLVFGLKGGAAFGVMCGLSTFLAFQLAALVSILIAAPYADVGSPVDPITAWRRDRASGIVVGVALGLTLGLLTGVAFGLSFGVARGVTFGATACLTAGAAIALSFVRSWDARLSYLQIRWAGLGPINLMSFLADAHSRGVLRTVGPVYQFRHARLRDSLATTFEART